MADKDGNPDSLDWTPQQALQHAMNLCDGKEEGMKVPDGILIIYHYEDHKGDGKEWLYTNSGLNTYQVMCLTNYVNHRAARRCFDEQNQSESD